MNSVQEACLSDIVYLYHSLRDADRAEFSLEGKDPWRTLEAAFEASTECRVLKANSWPYFIVGVVQTDDGAVVWGCGTDELAANAKHLLRETKRLTIEAEERYGQLYNLVWTGNPVHIKWIKHMGFELSEPLIINDIEYIYFTKGAPRCVAQKDS